MALKFNGDLSTGDESQWDSIAGLLGSVSADAGFDSGYRFRVALTNNEDNNYLSKAVTNTHYRSFECSFKFRVSNANITNTNRVIRMLQANGTSSPEFAVQVTSDATGGQIDQLQVLYRDSAGTLTTLSSALDQTTIQSNTVHEFRVLYVQASELGGDGFIRVWIDGVLWADHSALTTRSGAINALWFGVVTTTTSLALNVDVGDFKTATNSDYSEAVTEYWIDSIGGDDTNDGTEAAPFKTAFRAITSAGTGTAGTGDEIVIKKRPRSTPHRMSVMGPIAPLNGGAANACVIVRGEDRSDPTEIFGTVSVPPALWSGPDGEGTYSFDATDYVTASGSNNYPYRIYVCTEAEWQASGFDAIDPQLVGRVAERPMSSGTTPYEWHGTSYDGTNNTARTWEGGLTAGQAGFHPNTATIYYRPAEGETFADLHIEVPFRTASYSAPVTINTDHTVARYLNVFFGHTACFTNGSGGSGSFIERNLAVSAGQFPIGANGSVTMYRNETSWAVDLGWNSGTGLHTGTGGTANIVANISHDNANDGISLNSATPGGDISYVIGNLCYNNGVSATGNEYGIEVTGTAVGKCYFNTLVGNYGGYVNQSSVTAGQECIGNIAAYNQTAGFNVTTTQHTANANLLDYNAAYGNGGNGFHQSGVGAIAGLVGTVTADPEFTNILATVGVSVNRVGGDYTLSATSPCRETTDGAAIVSRYWALGARPSCIDTPVPDRRACMGAYQS